MPDTQFVMKIWKLSKNYTKLTIWDARETGELICTFWERPIAGQSRRERYNLLARTMRQHNIEVPPFKSHNAEVSHEVRHERN